MAQQSHPYVHLVYPVPHVSHNENGLLPLIISIADMADAGYGASASAEYLLDVFDSELVADFNADEFFDYRASRPTLTIEDGIITNVKLPHLRLYSIRDDDNHQALLLTGAEPSLRWQALNAAVSDFIEQFQVTNVIFLHAVAMPVPHTRPTLLLGHGSMVHSLPEGSNVLAIQDTFRMPAAASMALMHYLEEKMGVPVLSLAAQIPHYLASNTYPDAVLTLLKEVASVAQLRIPLLVWEQETLDFQDKVAHHMENNDELRPVVAQLERQFDDNAFDQPDSPELPSAAVAIDAEQLSDEFMKFLTQFGNEDHPDSEDGRGEGSRKPTDS